MFGDPYYWSPECCEIIEGTAPSLPDFTLRVSDFLSEHGWMWFSTPLKMPPVTDYVDDDIDTSLAGLTWSLVRYEAVTEEHMRLVTFVGPGLNPNGVPESLCGAVIGCYVLHEGRPLLLLASSWMAGESLGREVQEFESGIDGDHAWGFAAFQYFAAAITFTQQHIFVHSRQPALRPTRKRAQKVMGHTPLVRVVKLRRAANPAQHDTPGQPVEWSCRWVVSGHWREQYYPKTKEHRPLFVLPYVKGPQDKPLRPPRAKVFAVVR
jgi:hypothetical protein